MPEGDTIYRAARTLQRALAGQLIRRFETGLAQLAVLDRDEPIEGRTIDRVESVGKHLLMTFSGALILRTHMRMNGSWHIYRPGEKWQRPESSRRIVLETREWVAVAFDVYNAEFVRADLLSTDPVVATLGPDLLGDFDANEALARVRKSGSRHMHEVLLDQRVMAGIGNVYKSELLFLSGIHPDTPAAMVDDERWQEIMRQAQSLLRANVAEASPSGIVTYRGLRRTTGQMNPSDRLWVYGRSGKPCRKCGTVIAFRKDGDAARVTYWCPTCQSPL